MPHLVPDGEPQALGVQRFHQARGEHDERLVDADSHRVGLRIALDEHGGNGVQVEGVDAFDAQPVQARVLLLTNPDRRGQGEEAFPALAEQSGRRLEHLPHAGHGTQPRHGAAVGGVLVGAGTDTGKPHPHRRAGHLGAVVSHVVPPRCYVPRGRFSG